jgi:ABC-type antimicrobial peptide transport system permease subunit
MLVGVKRWDPVALAFGAAVLLAAVASAVFVPARRATRINPSIALKRS